MLSKYKYEGFSNFKIKHSEVLKFIDSQKNKFEIIELGKSIENREIFALKTGKGLIKILLWSQMHGNEPVSTMALIDLLNFLSSDENKAKELLQKLEIIAIPMLNPDGAENFERRNAISVDLNRDAKKLISPESKILNRATEDFSPDFGFNLHDQEAYYGIEGGSSPTMMSFLSPAFNKERNIDNNRKITMQVIAGINIMLRKEFSNIVTARYSDAFMPNAFGDFIQSKGIKTILFEGGYIIGDINRQQIRVLYSNSLLFALQSITNKQYEKYTVEDYDNIPQNIKLKFTDLILKNVSLLKGDKKFYVDIAIRKKITNSEVFSDTINEYIIDDIGDMSYKNAFKIIDCKNKSVKINSKDIKRLANADELLKLFKIKL